MNVYINRQPINGPYGGGNLWVRAAHEELTKKGHTLLPPQRIAGAPDVVLLAGMDADNDNIGVEQAIMYKMMVKDQKDIKLVLRVNENDARKGTKGVDSALVKFSQYVDGTVFVSEWLQKYFNDLGWKCSNQTVIHNGVDAKIFAPQPKLNNGLVNIVAHHWSDNVMKGFDIYEEIDRFVGPGGEGHGKFSFAYIGRDRRTFKNTTVVRPLFGEKLGQELGKYDVYVSASRFDPGPNHITESISCGLPTYVHKDGGGAVEFAGADHSYSDWNALKQLLLNGSFAQNSTSFLGWEACITEYNDFMESLCPTT